ncbi:MAG: hypothetical protein ACI9EW_004042 [Cellvibrionaceae bacterium]|jgi:hypothetical protein
MNKRSFPTLNNRLWLLIGALMTVVVVMATSAKANPAELESNQSQDSSAAPSWLEPQPLSIVDLISGGMDPALLAGSPVSWLPGQALLQYTSGSKSGTIVNVNAKMLPTFSSEAYCLGQAGARDQWSTVVPESKIKIRSNGTNITSQISSIQYFPAGLEKPIKGSSDGSGFRYSETTLSGGSIQFDVDGRLIMPANMGCQIFFSGGAANGGNITLEYEHDLKQYIDVDIVDSLINHEFKSYFQPGQGALGALTSLNEQIVQYKKSQGNADNRHDKFTFVPPAEANYIVMVYPPTALDMYAPLDKLQTHKRYEGSGTYRLRENKADYRDISIDWISMAGIPLNFHTKDSDFSSGEKYLDFFKVKQTPGVAPEDVPGSEKYRFHALEVIALDNEYDPCMTNGGCSDDFLSTISGTRMYVDVYYLKVERIIPGLTQIPLCSVGPSWSAADAGTKCNDYHIAGFELDQAAALDEVVSPEQPSFPLVVDQAQQANSPFIPNAGSFVYLPLINKPLVPEPDNVSADCPCGWFTDDGRMLGYVEPPGS